MSGDFAGFISYSRRASAPLAADLQTAVERFAKPWYQLRAVRIFRDDATMSANTALWPTIEQALVSAEWLILVTSPAAAASQWVGNEVRWWLEHKSADRVVIVLEEGPDLVWDPTADDFDWPNTGNLPPALRGAFAEEPRWIDLRWYEEQGSLRKADPRWPERVADVAAAVRFIERDQLIGENVREHRRALRTLRAGIVGLSLLLVASLVATVIAVLQGREADRQADIARAQEREASRQATIALARSLAAQADALAATDLRTASLLAVAAYRTNDDAQTRSTLFQLATASPTLVRTLPVGSRVLAVASTPEGVAITGSEDGVVQRWDGPAAEQVADLDGRVFSVSASDDATVVLAVASLDDGGAEAVLVRDGNGVPLTGIGDAVAGAVSSDGTWIATSGSGRTDVWSLAAGAPEHVERIDVGGTTLTFGAKGLAVFDVSGAWALLDLDDRTYRGGFQFFGSGIPFLAVSADGATLASAAGRRDYDVWRDDAVHSDGAPTDVATSDLAGSRGIALTADGSRLATFADGQLSLVKVRRTGAPAVRPIRLGGIGEANVGVIAFGGDRHLVTGNGDDALVWDVDQLFRFGRQLPAEVPDSCPACPLPEVSVSPDGTRVLVQDDEKGTSVVDLDTGAQRFLSSAGLAIDAADWLDDGRIVGASAGGGVLVIDPSASTPVRMLDVALDPNIDVVAIAAEGGDDGRVVALHATGLVETVDLDDGSVERATALVPHLRDLQPLLWGVAPDLSGAYLGDSIEGADGLFSTRLFALDLASGQVTTADANVVGAAYDARSLLHVFDGTSAGVLGEHGALVDPVPASVVEQPRVVLDPSGRIVVTGGRDGVVHLIDLGRQGAEFGTVEVPAEEGSDALSAFSPDGSSLVTAIQPMESYGLGSTVRVMSLEPEAWVDAACAVAARDLTVEDWARYGVGDPPADLRCAR